MPLFDKTPVEEDVVRRVVKEHFDIDLGANVKASQNYTYIATQGTGESAAKFVVRVTPDPTNSRVRDIALELELIDYVQQHGLPVCSAILSKVTNEKIVRDGPLTFCVFNFATGEPVVYQDWKWFTDKTLVVGQGKWLGKFHNLSKQFAKEHASLLVNARQWTELHDGVLKGVPVHPDDEKTRSDPNKYGLIHGDVNPSNYFWIPELGVPCMFDWDQAQLCWFLYDISSPIWGVITLEGTGSPMDMMPVPEANSEQFTNWLLEGYESISESGPVDRDALARMIKIRRELYWRFCSKALAETTEDSAMGKFCRVMVNWLEKSQ
jgi:Ser/Thr protein kinase RdoA (MazF antagonist)